MRGITSFGEGIHVRSLAWLTAVAAFVALLGLTSISQAQPAKGINPMLKDLDSELRKHTPKILAELKKRNPGPAFNVGVLKFQVQIDHRKPTLHSGRLNQQMATRLENALILSLKDADKIGVTRDAGTAAAKKNKNMTYLTSTGRGVLLQEKYPLAWGKTKVPVNSFLTGLLILNNKTKIGEVQVKYFDKKTKDLQPLYAFKFKMDRNILSESAQRFTLSRSALKNGKSWSEMDEETQTPTITGGLTPVDTEFNSILDFRIFYDGVEIPTALGSDGTFKCDPPPTDTKKVVFKIKAAERIGLVLLVNGVNTFLMDKAAFASVDQQSRWIMDANKEYTIEGFYPSFEKCLPFAVVPDLEADPGELGPEDKWGLIELHVFRETANVVEGLPSVNLQNPYAEGSSPRDLKKQFSKLQAAKAKNLIVPPHADGKSVEIAEAVFNGTFAASRTITYFQRGGGTNED